MEELVVIWKNVIKCFYEKYYLWEDSIIYKKYYLWKILNIIKINNIKSWVIFIIFKSFVEK